MALNANNMASEVVAAVATLSDTDKGNSTKVWEKVCGAIVDHIKNNMEVKGVNVLYNTGTLIAGVTPVTIVPPGTLPTCIQSNDGTGLVE